jgi:MFS family permease
MSFLASALLLRSIRTEERNEPAPSRGMWRDVTEGLRSVLTHPTLRALLGAGVTINFFAMAYVAVYILYMVNTLGIPKGLIGALIAMGGVGGLVGAWLTTRLTKRYGENRILLVTVIFFPIEVLTAGLLNGPLWWNVTAMTIVGLMTGGVVVAFSTCLGVITLRETPKELRGRVNATMTFAVQGVLALGGLAGGVVADQIGLRPVILLCAAGMALTTFWIWLSPLRPRTPERPHLTPAPATSPAPNALTRHLMSTKRHLWP